MLPDLARRTGAEGDGRGVSEIMMKKFPFGFFLILFSASLMLAQEAALMEPVGERQVKVAYQGVTALLAVEGPDVVTVTDEKYESLALFQGPFWRCGTPLEGPKAEACSVCDALETASLVVRDGPGEASAVYTFGKDYQFEPRWAGFGRIEGGAIPAQQPVYASYRYVMRRLDSVVLTAANQLVLRRGVPHVATPALPPLAARERRAGNIWISGWMKAITPAELFPVLETAYPTQERVSAVAERLLPKTLAKLRGGSPVRILAWGDSVTECLYLSLSEKWQEQFAAQLRQRFPGVEIVMLTEGWGGRTTTAYRNEPPGSLRNYAEKVLALKPDLIVSEFINDASMDAAAVQENYGTILKDFKAIGAEWIILTPHYSRPDWMGLQGERDIDDDPRPYVQGLRLFGEKNNVAIADASLRWGRLWRQGIPYTSMLVNNINHPDAHGMRIFADALMECFPQTLK